MSKYKDRIDDRGFFLDILPDGWEIYRSPDLPTLKFRTNGVKYEVTDMRFLNETALNVFSGIIEIIAGSAKPDVKSVEISFSDMDDNTLDLITTILLAIKVKATKGGKRAWCCSGTFLITGITKRGDNITFELAEDQAQAIWNYCRTNKFPINFYELAVKVINDQHERLIKALEKINESEEPHENDAE